MKTAVWLRVAAVLTLSHAALHTIGGVFGAAPSGVAAATYATMQAHTFTWMGEMRSYAIFLRGMGLAVSVMLTLEAVVMWQLGSLARREAGPLRPVAITLLVGYVALAVNSYEYFFLGAAVAELLIAACLAGAAVTAKGVQIPAAGMAANRA